jgi:hypothetical protein
MSTMSSPFSSEYDANRALFQDDFQQIVGKELPSHLRTKTRRWASLLLVAVSGAFASGPFASWPTLEPLLIAEGVWAGPDQLANLTSVYSLAMGVAMMSLLLAGIFYDVIGARGIGAGGAFGTSVCLVAMALAIKIPSLNNLLWIAYPAANIFGWANSMDTYAWLWLLPEDQNTVAAVAGAIQCLSDSFCLVAVFMHDYLGFQLPVYFCFTACLSLVAGFVALALVPSREEMQQITNAVIRNQGGAETSSNQGYGSTASDGFERQVTPFQRQVTPFDGEIKSGAASWADTFSKAWTAICDTFILYGKVHPTLSVLFFVQEMAQYMFTVYPSFEMYPLYKGLLGSSKAVELVNIYGGTYACIGAACLLLSGRIVDRIGMVRAICCLNVLVIVNAILYAVPTFWSQVVAQVVLAWVINVWYVFIPRFCMAYGPPELFGTMYGVISGLLGLGQIVLTPVGTWACSAIMLHFFHGYTSPATPILVTIDLWCFLTVVATLVLMLWWWYYPLPADGSTTMDHVRKAYSDPDGAGGEALLLTGVTKEFYSEVVSKSINAEQQQQHQQRGRNSRPTTCCGCLPTFEGA